MDASTAVAGLGTFTSSTNPTPAAIEDGTVTLGPPVSAGDAFQSQSSALSPTFTATQRDGGGR